MWKRAGVVDEGPYGRFRYWWLGRLYWSHGCLFWTPPRTFKRLREWERSEGLPRETTVVRIKRLVQLWGRSYPHKIGAVAAWRRS